VKPIKLHAGCGPHVLDGWVNVDVMAFPVPGVQVMDVTQPWPFSKDSVELVLAEDLIEWFYTDQSHRFFQECHRCLVDGGTLRVAFLNVQMIRWMLESTITEEHVRYVEWHRSRNGLSTITPLGVINGLLRSGRQTLWNIDELTLYLRGIGFRAIVECCVGVSVHQELNKIEHSLKTIPAEFRPRLIKVIEATK
jgi:hypothetical protein